MADCPLDSSGQEILEDEVRGTGQLSRFRGGELLAGVNWGVGAATKSKGLLGNFSSNG